MDAPCLLMQSDVSWPHTNPAPATAFSLLPLKLGAHHGTTDMAAEKPSHHVALGLGLGPTMGGGLATSPSAGSSGGGDQCNNDSQMLHLELSPSCEGSKEQRARAQGSNVLGSPLVSKQSPRSDGDGDKAGTQKSGSSRYESQKRRDWNTFGQYLKNHRPPIAVSSCTAQHVLEFLSYLDQFGKTKVHDEGCRFFGSPGSNPCGCPMKQAWGSLDSLVGRLRAAYEENGGSPETNPFAQRVVRVHLREVKEAQAKARGVDYEKRKRRRRAQGGAHIGALEEDGPSHGREAQGAPGEDDQIKKLRSMEGGMGMEGLGAQGGLFGQTAANQWSNPSGHNAASVIEQELKAVQLARALQAGNLFSNLQHSQAQSHSQLLSPTAAAGQLLGLLGCQQLQPAPTPQAPALDQNQVEQQLLLELLKQQQALAMTNDPSGQALLDALLKRALGR